MSFLCSKPSTGSPCVQNKTVLTTAYQAPHNLTPFTLRPYLPHHPHSLALLLRLKHASAPLHLLFPLLSDLCFSKKAFPVGPTENEPPPVMPAQHLVQGLTYMRKHSTAMAE